MTGRAPSVAGARMGARGRAKGRSRPPQPGGDVRRGPMRAVGGGRGRGGRPTRQRVPLSPPPPSASPARRPAQSPLFPPSPSSPSHQHGRHRKRAGGSHLGGWGGGVVFSRSKKISRRVRGGSGKNKQERAGPPPPPSRGTATRQDGQRAAAGAGRAVRVGIHQRGGVEGAALSQTRAAADDAGRPPARPRSPSSRASFWTLDLWTRGV